MALDKTINYCLVLFTILHIANFVVVSLEGKVETKILYFFRCNSAFNSHAPSSTILLTDFSTYIMHTACSSDIIQFTGLLHPARRLL